MKKLYFICGILCTLLCVVCILLALPTRPTVLPDVIQQAARTVLEYNSAASQQVKEPQTEESAVRQQTKTDPLPVDTELEDTDPVEDAASESEPEAPPYESPVDFAALQAENADIYAWLYIPDTDINYPVLQSTGRISNYYINHNVQKKRDSNGSIFTEFQYNGQDFSDPVTVVYGHDMRSGQMFGTLQKLYSDEDAFGDHGEVLIFTPEAEYHYRVFACVPYSGILLFYTYNNFETPEDVSDFLADLRSARGFGTNLDQDVEVGEDDRLLVLSTCLRSDRGRRYLVVAKLLANTDIQ